MAPNDRKLTWRLRFLPEFEKPAAKMREAVRQIRSEVRGLVDEVAKAKASIGSLRGLRTGGGGGGRRGGGGGTATGAAGPDDDRKKFQDQLAQIKKQIALVRGANRQREADELKSLQRLQASARQREEVEKRAASIIKNERREAEADRKRAEAADRKAERDRQAAFRNAERDRKKRQRDELNAARERLRAAQQLNSVQEGGANRVLFTFRRLVGVLAVFTLAREAVNAFSASVRSALQFSQVVNATRIGIAGLVSTLGLVRDEQGNILSGSEAFNASISVSSKLQKQLLADSIRTTATYKELLDVFQIALGPGLAAGLNLDQIRQLSVLVSQAASALQIPQVQLSEEIRALLTGQIRQGQSRLATSILLTPEQVRRFRAQGTLFQELQRRLKGFDIAAEEVAKTAGGALTRLADAVQLVLGQAAQPLEQSALTQLDALFRRFVTISTDGLNLDVNPQAVAAFQEIFNILSDIVDLVGQELQNVDFNELRTSIASLRQPIADIVAAVIELSKAVLSGLAFVTKLLGPLAAIGQALAPIGGFILANILIPLGAVRLALGGVLNLFLRLPLIGNLIQRALVNAAAKAGREFDLATEKANALKRLAAAGFVLSIALQVALDPEAAQDTTEKLAQAVGNSLRFFGIISQETFDRQTAILLERQAVRQRELQDRAQAVGTGATAADIRREMSQATVDPKKKQADAEALAVAKAELEVRRQKFFIAAQETLNETRLSQLRGAGLEDDRVRVEELKQTIDLLRERKELAKREATEALAQSAKKASELETDEERNVVLKERDVILDELADKEAKINQEGLEAMIELNRLERQLAQQRQNRVRTASAELAGAAFEFQAGRLGPQGAAQAESLRGQADLERLRAEQENLAAEQQRVVADRLAAEALLQAGSRERTELEEQTLVILQEQAAAGLQLQARIDAAEKAQRRLNARAEGRVGLGIAFAFDDFIEEFSNGFDAAIRAAKDGLQSLGSFTTKVIVDGFVRVGQTGSLKDFFDGIKQTFANFLIEIVQAIISQLVQLAIAKALVFAGFGGAAQGGLVAGAAKGGYVRGYDQGGPVGSGPPAPVSIPRPAGLDRRDTVPAFLRPGEFVQTPEAVGFYGADVMEALRQRAIDPVGLRSLLGGRSFTPRRVAMHSFAEGGPVLTTPSTTRENTVLPSSTTPRRSAAAVLPVREDQFDRMMNSNAFDRTMHSWLRRNRTEARQNLNS